MPKGRSWTQEARTQRWVVVFMAMVVSLNGSGCGHGGKGRNPEGMVYGGPAARITQGETPPAAFYSGASLSLAPEVRPAPSGPTTDVRIDVTHQEVSAADGVRYTAWTFGGVVPGPVIHVKQGTRVRFTLMNRSDRSAAVGMAMPHSIDFHAAMVDPVDKYQTVAPGGTIRFEWTPNYPGVFMYHCATPPVLQHIASGMYGMVIVEPRDGYPTKVDREYALVQSELYLAPSKAGVDTIDMAAARLKRPAYVVFNGRAMRHMDEPLPARAGERVRLYVLNVGPNGTSSFHVIGTVLDRVWIDGNPANEMRGLQTVLLPASGGAIVEFVIPEDGIYTFLDHEFADAEVGALGNINALGGGAPMPAGAGAH